MAILCENGRAICVASNTQPIPLVESNVLNNSNVDGLVSNSDPANEKRLVQGLGLPQSIALNIANMVGIGPFITIPLFIAAMHGPQALIAWVIAAVLVICDGLIWSELGAALPGSGGTYHFLREIFGKQNSRWARLLPFLYVWQFLVSGTMEIASGYTGAMPYVQYIWPELPAVLEGWLIPGGTRSLAAMCALLVTWMLSRRIETVGWVGIVLCTGTLITVATVIVSGLIHFDSSLLTFPPDAFQINGNWIQGLGAAMLIAIYDYLGYYNICNLGEEVRNPGRTIPRAVITSVVLVAILYLTMNISIIAVVPWEKAMKSEQVASLFMETLYGRNIAVIFTGLILWTVLACVFSVTLGYSRIPFAAAKNGDFLPIFSSVHATKHYPNVSLWVVGGLTATFCYLDLQTVIEAAVTVRILVQFVAQILGLHVLRTTRPDIVMPFRMWMYPIPSLFALCGWLFVLGTRTEYLWPVPAVLASGIIAYLWFIEKPRAGDVTKNVSTNEPGFYDRKLIESVSVFLIFNGIMKVLMTFGLVPSIESQSQRVAASWFRFDFPVIYGIYLPMIALTTIIVGQSVTLFDSRRRPLTWLVFVGSIAAMLIAIYFNLQILGSPSSLF